MILYQKDCMHLIRGVLFFSLPRYTYTRYVLVPYLSPLSAKTFLGVLKDTKEFWSTVWGDCALYFFSAWLIFLAVHLLFKHSCAIKDSMYCRTFIPLSRSCVNSLLLLVHNSKIGCDVISIHRAYFGSNNLWLFAALWSVGLPYVHWTELLD